MLARPFHNTGMLARQTGVTVAAADTARPVIALARLLGAPPGNRALLDIRSSALT